MTSSLVDAITRKNDFFFSFFTTSIIQKNLKLPNQSEVLLTLLIQRLTFLIRLTNSGTAIISFELISLISFLSHPLTNSSRDKSKSTNNTVHRDKVEGQRASEYEACKRRLRVSGVQNGCRPKSWLVSCTCHSSRYAYALRKITVVWGTCSWVITRVKKRRRLVSCGL
jgi:hypothetical protein